MSKLPQGLVIPPFSHYCCYSVTTKQLNSNGDWRGRVLCHTMSGSKAVRKRFGPCLGVGCTLASLSREAWRSASTCSQQHAHMQGCSAGLNSKHTWKTQMILKTIQSLPLAVGRVCSTAAGLAHKAAQSCCFLYSEKQSNSPNSA